MPEGDTIFRTAQTLQRALAGRVVTRFESALPALTRVDEDAPIAGRTVVAVRSLGKHLLVEFSGGLALRTHMRMNGTWHIYRPAERWQRPRVAMRVVIETDEWVAVGFNVPVAEFLRTRDLARHHELARLGPDLLADEFDEQAITARLRTIGGGRPVGDALLDQRIMAGVGNVYKSEALFVCGIEPWKAVSALSDEQASYLVRTSRDLLKANVAPTARGARRTTRALNPESRLWVYGRGGRPCRRCGTPIACEARGESARLTYWCPKCQT
ncbi:MAG: DNA-formamidopyrimidine glycosylase family protein [Bacteroidales bacterium]